MTSELEHQNIELRGVRVHNLKNIDLDIPHGQFVSICGVSGSGKSSLAFDTLYAEGQRRYFDSLSTYTRQFLDQLDRPDVDRIDGIPPAIAIRAGRGASTSIPDRHRTTVGTASEVVEYLRLLFSRIGKLTCPDCEVEVQRHDPESVLRFLNGMAPGTKFQIAFEPSPAESDESSLDLLTRLKSGGFRRIIVDQQTRNIEELSDLPALTKCLVVVDRLTAGEGRAERIRESLETAFSFGGPTMVILLPKNGLACGPQLISIDARDWTLWRFSRDFKCPVCEKSYPVPEQQLFSFNSPLGACVGCEGFGTILRLDQKLIVPDSTVSIREGAIAPWNSPAYEHERLELLALADEFGIPVDRPFSELPDQAVRRIWDGIPQRKFGGLNGFFNWLEKRKYKVQIAVFLNRWKSKERCDACHGTRLNRDALAFQIGGQTIAALCDLQIKQAAAFVENLELTETELQIAAKVKRRIVSQLGYLNQVGLGYLSLNRSVASLSSGESQRVLLTKVLGSTLTGMLYVLDEPSTGLHVEEIPQLVESVRSLHRRGNTVVVVDHDCQMIMAAERVLELGPDAGSGGGEIVWDGEPIAMATAESSLTGEYLGRKRGLRAAAAPRRASQKKIRLRGARGNNLNNIDVDFPLGCLCVVTGVSGSGKSSLVQETLWPALSRGRHNNTNPDLPFDSLAGAGRLHDVVLIDQSPIGRSSRSNPVTYVKAFDEIRSAFAATADAKLGNLKAGHFSFNVDGGRCSHCRGAGQLTIDMQFMGDILVTCEQCDGKRFRAEVLAVRYRGHNIHEVLGMTVREAFGFFRGKKKVQTKLKALIDVGLDYIRLGQPATTLSSGEAQRLKLAHFLNAPSRNRVLFLMDEPTFGLHMRDVVKLVDCFDVLLAAGHSLIVIEHNLELIKHADWVIDLGPGAADAGGRLVAAGTPEQVSTVEESATGRCLSRLFAAEQESLRSLESISQ